MRVVYDSEQCVVYPKSEVNPIDDSEGNCPTSVRVSVFNFSLEGKSIQLEPRVREDKSKASFNKSASPQHIRIDLHREQGIHIPPKNKPSRVRRGKTQQRRQSDQTKSAREVVLTRRPSAVPRSLIPPRTPLVMSKMSMPSEGQKFSDNDNSVVVNTAEENSNVVKRLLGTNSVVEESTSTKKVTKQVAIKGNVSTTQDLTEAIQQQGTQALIDAATQQRVDNRQDTNNNKSLAEVNSNQVVNKSQQTSSKTTTSSSSTTSTKTTRRESYSSQTKTQESLSSSYEDVEDNSGIPQAICSPEQVKSNVNKTSKTSSTKVQEIRQSTLQSTSSIDSDISSVDEENIRKAKQDTQNVQQNTAVQQNTTVQQDTQKVQQQNTAVQQTTVQQNVNENLTQAVTQKNVDTAATTNVDTTQQQTTDTEKITSEKTDYNEQTKTMTMEEFQNIRKIKEYITIQNKLRNAEDGDTEEEEEESHEAEKIVTVDDIRQRLASKPPKEIIKDGTKDTQIVKGSRIHEIRTITRTVYPNPDNNDQEIEYETVTLEKIVVPAGTTILSKTDNTENTTQKQVITAGQETSKKTTTTESQQVKQSQTQVNETGSTTNTEKQNVVQKDTATATDVQNVQVNTQNVQNANVQTVQNVQDINTENVNKSNVQNTQNVQETQNVQNTTQNVQSTNVQNVQKTSIQNVQSTNVQETQNIQKNVQETQNVQKNAQEVQNVQETQNVQKNVQEVQNVQETQKNVQDIQQSQQVVQNEAVKKTSVNTIKQTQKTILTSSSSVDSETSNLDEASRLISNTQLATIDNQTNPLSDINLTSGAASTVTQTSSKTTKVTESRKVIKQSSSAAPETQVEESSQTTVAEQVVNAVCGADGKFNVEENTKTSTTVSSGVGDEDELKRQIKTQNKNTTKKMVSDGKVVTADVDQYREKIVREEEGSRDQPTVTFSQKTSDSKHKHMEEDASKFTQLPALPSPDDISGGSSPQIDLASPTPK